MENNTLFDEKMVFILYYKNKNEISLNIVDF